MNEFGYLLSRIKKSLRSRRKTFRINKRARLKRLRAHLLNLGTPEAVIWVFGCQRSGTTLLERIFRHDLDSAVFGEFSELTIGERKSVLSKPETIQQIVGSQNARYAVIRPLFESNRASELLDLFPKSVGVWLFRDCPHVVDSMIRKWGDRFFEISKKVESNEDGIWRLEQTSESIWAAAQQAAPANSLTEAYARYWLSRNQIPFRNGLTQDLRMVFLSYRQLVLGPRTQVETIIQRAGLAGVWGDFNVDVYTSSIDRPVDIALSEETLKKCKQVYQQLIACSNVNLPG